MQTGSLEQLLHFWLEAVTAFLYYARRYDEFMTHCQGWFKRDPSVEWRHHHCLGAAYVQMGRREEAIAELQEALKPSTMFEHTATELANALAVAGKQEGALKVLDRVDYVPWKTFGAALVHAGLGENDEAFHSLQKAIELRATSHSPQNGSAIRLAARRSAFPGLAAANEFAPVGQNIH